MSGISPVAGGKKREKGGERGAGNGFLAVFKHWSDRDVSSCMKHAFISHWSTRALDRNAPGDKNVDEVIAVQRGQDAPLALNRAMRPARFDEVREQDAIVTTLRNQVKTGRISHAYLLSGSRGIGKTTIARILARAINCETPADGDACGRCPACAALQSENMDVVEIDAASNNSVDQIRDLREKVKYPPSHGRYRVYIIDEVHMLSTGAFNALLKTLEEPPAHAVFILATTEPQKLPATVLSRCQRFDFRRMTVEGLVRQMKCALVTRGRDADEDALVVMARAAEGGMRDALNLLETALSFVPGRITIADAREMIGAADQRAVYALIDALIAMSPDAALAAIDEAVRGGADIGVFLRDAAMHVRALLVTLAVPDSSALLEVTAEDAASYGDQARKTTPERLLYLMTLMNEAEAQLKYSASPRLTAELCALRACHPESDGRAEALFSRVEALEKKIENWKTMPSQVVSAEKAAEYTVRSVSTKPPAPKKPLEQGAEVSKPQNAAAMWKDIVDALKAEHGMLIYMILRGSTAVAMTNDELTVEAPASNYNALVKPDKNAQIHAIAARVAGKPLRVNIVQAGAGALKPAERADVSKELFTTAVEMFGRDIVSDDGMEVE